VVGSRSSRVVGSKVVESRSIIVVLDSRGKGESC